MQSKAPGRGTSANPKGRFERLHFVADPGEESNQCKTEFLRDSSRSILTRNTSPDVGYEFSINPYRGCEHGCIYCYARPTHEYLGFSPGLDFETKVLVKEDAAELLRRELSSASWKPRKVAVSGVTDAYQPIERKLRLTRACLEVLAEFLNPVSVVTKNRLVTRDIDLLSELAMHNAVTVSISLTTLDPEIHRNMEPRTSAPAQRLEAIRELSSNGIPTYVLIAPVIPGLTDHELPALVEAAAKSGAVDVSYAFLRLPRALQDLFPQWLEERFPNRASRVLNRIREIRGGQLNDSRFYWRMKGTGTYALQMKSLFEAAYRKANLNRIDIPLSTASFRRPQPNRQLRLF